MSMKKVPAAELFVEPTIVLRSFRLDDADKLFVLVNSNYRYLSQWLPWVPTVQSPADSCDFIKHQNDLMALGKEITYGIFVEGQLSGCIGTHAIDWPNKKTSLGYWLAQEQTGNKIMQRCTRTFIDYLFTCMHLNRIEIRCATQNMASRKIAENLSMVEEGVLRENEWLNGRYVDHILYGLTRTEYKKGLVASG
jgi:ribosomal-protein-serine acetyltransferase